MIETLEIEKVFDFTKEPEVRMIFDDIFTLDIQEFYPQNDIFLDNEMMIPDIPPIKLIHNDSVEMFNNNWGPI